MKRGIITKIVTKQIKQSKELYYPFILSLFTNVFAILMYSELGTNIEIVVPTNSTFFQEFFWLGIIILGLFSLIFLLYTNNIVTKRYAKNIGVLLTIGIPKKGIFLVISLLYLIMYVIGFVLASLGAYISKLIIAGIIKRTTGVLEANLLQVDFSLLLNVFLFFFVLVFILIIQSYIMISRKTVRQLLSFSAVPTKIPKSSSGKAVLGLIFIIFTWTIMTRLKSFLGIFLAVPLIIIATYLFFNYVSINYISRMKRSKKFLKVENFIPTSNLLFRMSKNGISLANICILSTLILLALTTASSVFFGKETMIDNRLNRDVYIETNSGNESASIKESINILKEEYQATFVNYAEYDEFTTDAILKEDVMYFGLTLTPENISNHWAISIIPLEDYNNYAPQKLSLEENEIAIYSLSNPLNLSTLKMQNQALQKEFKILELDSFYIKERIPSYLFRHLYIVVDSINEINEIVGSTEESHVISFDVTEEVDTEFFYSLDDTLKREGTIFYEIKKIVSDEWIMYFGGGLILLIFMSLLFMMTFILTLYFKQISEGYEDAKRYDIYRKLGVSEKIIKNSTSKQMLRIFSIPLLGALLHGIFSLFLIRRILLAFRMSNFMIILNSFLVIAFIFAVVYYISYKLTSRVYYRIIS
ncbi:hypothetical protein [Petrotoga sp. DB-2]